MSNPYTKAAAIKEAEERSKLANERFGYRLALRIVLIKHGYTEIQIKELLELARTREIEQLEEILNK